MDVEENPPVPLVIPSVKVEAPDDHVILISFKWLFMDIACLNSVELYLGGDQLKKSNKCKCIHSISTWPFCQSKDATITVIKVRIDDFRKLKGRNLATCSIP